MFLLVVWFTARSTYRYPDVDVGAGQLAGRHKHEGVST